MDVLINVVLKSSAQREPWGSGGVAPRKKTRRPIERDASVVCVWWSRDACKQRRQHCCMCVRRVHDALGVNIVFIEIRLQNRCVSGRTGAPYTGPTGRQVVINIGLRVAISILIQTFCSLPQRPGLPFISRMYTKWLVSRERTSKRCMVTDLYLARGRSMVPHEKRRVDIRLNP